jgi:hypothetical protein
MSRSITLRYNPQLLTGTYGINIHIKKPEVSCRIQFEEKVQFAGNISNDLHAFRITRDNLLINGIEPDEHIFELANECSKIIYPITLLTNNKGLCHMVRNDDIRQRWLEKKYDIEKRFVGEGSELYISLLEDKINNPDYISLLVEKDLFISLFFGLMYETSIVPEKMIKRCIPVLPFDDPVEFACQNSIMECERNKELIVCENGSLSDEACLDKLIKNELNNILAPEGRTLSGACDIKYTLDSEYHNIKSIESTFVLKLGESNIMDIVATAYYLSEKPIESIQDEYINQLRNSQGEAKKTWFYKLLTFS